MQSKPTAAACDRLLGVLTWCMTISNTTKADCFFSYEPHCNSYSVNIHRDGWKSGEEAEWINMVTDITSKNVAETCAKLNKIYEELKEKEDV